MFRRANGDFLRGSEIVDALLKEAEVAVNRASAPPF
jgi:hypothetical protein